MTTEPILCHIEEHVATLTLNQPSNLNAMDIAMGKAFQKTLVSLDKNKEVRAVIITGAGRSFSSGGNLEMLEEKLIKNQLNNYKDLKNFYSVFLGVRKLRVPVIAAINGAAVGAGFCLSLACDLRYASSTAKIGANFARLGLAPGMGGSYLVTRLVGPTRAAEVLLLAEILSASKAFDMGLLNGVFEPENLMSHVLGVAKVIAGNAPFAIETIKTGIQMAMHATLEKMFDYDARSQAKSFASEDIKEGIKAVREKRSPKFIGK